LLYAEYKTIACDIKYGKKAAVIRFQQSENTLQTFFIIFIFVWSSIVRTLAVFETSANARLGAVQRPYGARPVFLPDGRRPVPGRYITARITQRFTCRIAGDTRRFKLPSKSHGARLMYGNDCRAPSGYRTAKVTFPQ